MSNHNCRFAPFFKNFLHLSVLFFSTATAVLFANDTSTLAQDGESRFDIVAIGDAGVEQTAIRELADYLQRISGAQFVVKKQRENKPAIFVGTKEQSLFNGKFVHLQARDSFSIRTQEGPNGRDIYLVGHDSTATAFAVYTFLEDLGCRWFMPGEIGEVVPAAKKLTWTRRERTEQPDFIFRQIWWAYGGPPETAEQFKMWKLHNKVAYPLIQHGHNLTNTLPPKIYFDEHPEYYALVNGERRTTQLCTSNPEVVRLVIERINAYFDEHPDVEAYSLCPDDNTDFCECDDCRALDVGGADKYLQGKPVVTDRYIHFLNAVAQGIQERHPGKKVSTYAYVNYSTPPLREKIDPHVVIILTSSVYCGAHGIGDLHCASRQAMKQDLAGWTAAAEVYIYDYDPTPYNAELPWPLFGARWREMAEYLAMGVKGFTFESHNSWATLAPNFYVAAKSMWDAHLDFDALMNDYMQKFFGESAAPMADYYRTLEAALAAASGKVEWGQLAYPKIFTKNVLGRCRGDIDRAVQSAIDPKVQERVRAVALGFEYLENYIQLRNAVADRPTLAEFKAKYNRCLEIIDQLYEMNKDYILHDVAVDYLNRGIGKIATSAYAADLGLITDWMLLGPFDNRGNAGHDHRYPPEQEIDLSGVYAGINNETVKWREHHNPEYLGKIDLLPLFEHNSQVCAYAMTTVETPTAKEVQFRVGSNDLVKVWLNGEQIWNWDKPSGRLVSLDDDVIPVTLPAGKSSILLKISNLGGNWGFCFRITDAEGNRIPELKYSLSEAK